MNLRNDLVDALPYIDGGYDEPGVREAVLSMIEEETKRYKPTKNYLEHLGIANYDSFETDVMKAEFERIENQKPMEVLNMRRYELPPPPPNRLNDMAAWNESVANSQAQLEHQANRILNLQVMNAYGTEAWKVYNKSLEQTLQRSQKQLAELRRQVQEINYERKKAQLDAGQKLGHLETNWIAITSKNFEIEQACVELEKEISLLESHRKQARRLSSSENEEEQRNQSEAKRLKKSEVEEDEEEEVDEEEDQTVPEQDLKQTNDQEEEEEETATITKDDDNVGTQEEVIEKVFEQAEVVELSECQEQTD